MKMRVKNRCAVTNAVTALERENRALSYRAALEGIVLLKNNGCLPMEKGEVALYGAGAEYTIKGGIGSGEVCSRHSMSIREGLEEAGFTINTEPWLQRYRAIFESEKEKFKKDFLKKLVKVKPSELMNVVKISYQHPFGPEITNEDLLRTKPDTCIYVVARQAGEGKDRRLEENEYTLADEELANISRCSKYYKNIILVINVGGVIDLQCLDEIPNIGAVVFYCQQGDMGGKAFADLLCGKEVPSGKLTSTWPYRYEDVPYAMEYSYLNDNLEEEYYKEDIYVGYRHFDRFEKEPRYPFGYGLSYTEFQIETIQWIQEAEKVYVTVAVKNIGTEYAGKETVQLYASCPVGTFAKEYQRLVAFEKTKVLTPGEEEQVTLSFSMSDLASYDETRGKMVLEAGEYLLRVGNSSRNTNVCGALTIQETRGIRNQDKGQKEKPQLRQQVDDILNDLSLKEMIWLTVGAGMAGGTDFHAPGAAGATTGKLVKKGIPNVCLADGPAGLRLQKRTAVLKNGKLKAIDPYLSVLEYVPDFAKGLVLANPDKHPVIYQFTTAFPVGLSMAQTWNTELLQEVGDAVGKEMEAYGITYWLAPGMNIHRNPLCGRNYEYYSEDPLLTGKVAAAVTRGVQGHKGCFVTLKHFCCNNQEDNRNRTNANVSQRALFEIYLKGFEIAVKEGRPGAVMTSYNRLNGVYVCNDKRLLTDVLRKEWGFDGVVMTDWFATSDVFASHALALRAGNDLIMPGTKKAEKDIRKAVKEGVLKESDVKQCAGNVLRGILSSNLYEQ